MKKALVFAILFCCAYLSYGQLTAVEKQDLRYTLESEKLAHDVYEVFLANWNTFPFLDAKDDEAKHMKALYALMVREGMTDSIEKTTFENGVFALPVFKEWFAKHIASGMHSPTAAYKAAAFIEEVAIRDLEHLSAGAKDADLRYTYQWLIKTSKSHLYVFVCHLKRLNIEYKPVLLPYKEFDRIMREQQWQEPGKARA